MTNRIKSKNPRPRAEYMIRRVSGRTWQALQLMNPARDGSMGWHYGYISPESAKCRTRKEAERWVRYAMSLAELEPPKGIKAIPYSEPATYYDKQGKVFGQLPPGCDFAGCTQEIWKDSLCQRHWEDRWDENNGFKMKLRPVERVLEQVHDG